MADSVSNALPLPLSGVSWVGRQTITFVREIGRMTCFLTSAATKVFLPPYKPWAILQHIHFIGTKSLFVVSLTGLFAGMVLGLQGYYTLAKYGSESLLGSAVALSLIRELGPVLTALMVTGRAGSSITAEIGIMRTSEQIDALHCMDIHPVKFLVTPRLAAALVCFPLLTALFDVIGIFGGFITGVLLLGINSGAYFVTMESSVEMADVTGGFIKSLVFSVIMVTVCCFRGYTTHQRRSGFGAQGVSLSTTMAVVMTSVLVLVSDYVLTSLLL